MSSMINMSGAAKDLFAKGLSALPGKKILLDASAVGGCPKFAGIITDQKAVVTPEYLLALEQYFVGAEWTPERVALTVGSLQSPQQCVVEGVGGKVSVSLGMQNWGNITTMGPSRVHNPLVLELISFIKSVGFLGTVGSSSDNESDSSIVFQNRHDAIIGGSGMDSWSTPASKSMLPDIAWNSSLGYWMRDNLYATKSEYGTDLATAFSKNPLSDQYLLIGVTIGRSDTFANSVEGYVMRLMPRKPWMRGIAYIDGNGAYAPIWTSAGRQNYWRLQEPVSRSPLAVAIGASLRDTFLAEYVSIEGGTPAGYDRRLWAGDGTTRAHKPWYFYGWAGSVEGIHIEGDGELFLSEGFDTDPKGVGYLRIETRLTNTYVSKNNLVKLASPPAGADSDQLAQAQQRVADINASGVNAIIGQSRSKKLVFKPMAAMWSPYDQAMRDDVEYDMEVAPGVTVNLAREKGMSMPDSPERTIILSSGMTLAGAIDSVRVTQSTVAGVTSFSVAIGGVTLVEPEEALANIACGARVYGTSGSGTTDEKWVAAWWGTMVKGSSLLAWRSSEEAESIRNRRRMYSRRVPELYYLDNDLGNDWIGGQYAVDNGATDRSRNALDIHAMRGYSFGHRVSKVTGPVSAIRVDDITHPVSKVTF